VLNGPSKRPAEESWPSSVGRAPEKEKKKRGKKKKGPQACHQDGLSRRGGEKRKDHLAKPVKEATIFHEIGEGEEPHCSRRGKRGRDLSLSQARLGQRKLSPRSFSEGRKRGRKKKVSVPSDARKEEGRQETTSGVEGRPATGGQPPYTKKGRI